MYDPKLDNNFNRIIHQATVGTDRPAETSANLRGALLAYFALIDDICFNFSLESSTGERMRELLLVTFDDCGIALAIRSLAEFEGQLRVKSQAYRNPSLPVSVRQLGRLLLSQKIAKSSFSSYFTAVRTFLLFLSKHPSFCTASSDDAVKTWLETDRSLPTIDFDTIPFMREAQRIVEQRFRSFRTMCHSWGFRPRHGNGSTANAGKEKIMKYLHFHASHPVRLLMSNQVNGNTFGRLDEFAPLGFTAEAKLSLFEHHAHLITVPKSYKSLRTITKEPAQTQYYQQAVLRWLQLFIPTSGFQVDLRDQTKNQEMALFGASTGYFATVDLSSASDRVSWDIVKYLFRNTYLLRWLMATRTKVVRYTLKGKTYSHRVKMFAGMGSAVCFPIESLVFSSILEATLSLEGDLTTCYRVYGDDCILPTQYYDSFVANLVSIGMKVNSEKSYSKGPFRESCGCDCFSSHVITPLRYKLEVSELTRETVDQRTGLINLCNEFGYRHLRRYLIQSLPLDFLFYSANGKRGCQSDNYPLNWHLAKTDKVRYLGTNVHTQVPYSYIWGWIDRTSYDSYFGADCMVTSELSLEDCINRIAYFETLMQKQQCTPVVVTTTDTGFDACLALVPRQFFVREFSRLRIYVGDAGVPTNGGINAS